MASNAIDEAGEATVLTSALLKAGSILGLNRPSLAKCIGVTEAVLMRYECGDEVLQSGSKQWELAALLVATCLSASALVGDEPVLIRSWASSYNRALDSSPNEAILKAEGLAAVFLYLRRTYGHDLE